MAPINSFSVEGSWRKPFRRRVVVCCNSDHLLSSVRARRRRAIRLAACGDTKTPADVGLSKRTSVVGRHCRPAKWRAAEQNYLAPPGSACSPRSRSASADGGCVRHRQAGPTPLRTSRCWESDLGWVIDHEGERPRPRPHRAYLLGRTCFASATARSRCVVRRPPRALRLVRLRAILTKIC
jgi:hypothetical protein